MPNLDKMIAPTMDAGGYGSVTARMRSGPPEKTLYKEAHWPQRVSQSLTRESFTALDLAETSALDSAWHVVPF